MHAFRIRALALSCLALFAACKGTPVEPAELSRDHPAAVAESSGEHPEDLDAREAPPIAEPAIATSDAKTRAPDAPTAGAPKAVAAEPVVAPSSKRAVDEASTTPSAQEVPRAPADARPKLPSAAEKAMEGGRAALAEAKIAIEKKDFEAARKKLAPAISRLLKVEGEEATKLLEDLAFAAHEGEDLRSAARGFERVLASRSATLPADDLELQLGKQRLASVLNTLGERDRAERLVREAIESLSRTQPADSEKLMEPRFTLGSILSNTGRYAEANTEFESLLAMLQSRRPEDDPRLLAVRGNLAAARMSLGDWQGAREMYEAVLRVRERVLPPDHLSLQMTRINLAVVLRSLGEAAEARRLMELSLPIFEKRLPADHPQLLTVRSSMAAVLADLGDVAGSLAIEKEVLAIRELVLPPDDPSLQNSRQNVGARLLELNDTVGARALFEMVLAARERTLPANDAQVLVARSNLAGVLGQMGELDTARELLVRVVADGEGNAAYAQRDLLGARSNLAGMLIAAGEPQEARRVVEAGIADAAGRLPPENALLGHLNSTLVGVLLELGDRAALEPAVAELERSIVGAIRAAEWESSRASSGRIAALRDWIWMLLAAGPGFERAGFEVVSLARAVAAARPFDRSTIPAELRSDFDAMLEHGAAVQRAVGAGAAAGTDLVAAVRARDESEARMRRELFARGARGCEASAEELSRALEPDTIHVCYVRYSPPRWPTNKGLEEEYPVQLVAFVQGPKTAPMRVAIGSLADVEAAVERWREAIGKPISARGASVISGRPPSSAERERELGRELRRLVLDPVIAAYPDCRRIHVSLDDSTRLVPLDALPFDTGSAAGEYVGDRFTIHAEPGFGSLLRSPATKTAERRLLAMGGIDYGSGAGMSGEFAPLPATKFESETVASLFAKQGGEVVLLSGGDATREAFVREAQRARWIHVATHGWYSMDVLLKSAMTLDLRKSLMIAANASNYVREVLTLAPRTLCGLALSSANAGQGRFTAEELSGLDLSSCELAVLSACETNVGSNWLGFESMQTALHAAGVRASITSLWKVEDEATRLLFERMYARAWTEGQPYAQALWKAKESLRKEGRPTREWAGFVLGGAPR